MKRIKNYLLTTIVVFGPSILWAHPGHEHHGTGMELLFHFLVTFTLVLGLGVGIFRLAHYFLSKRDPVNNNQR